MKKIFLALTIYWFLLIPVFSETNIKIISDGKESAKIEIIVFESLTCSHCATFHKEIYPNLEKALLELLHNSGYPGIKFEKKVNFQELYNQRHN